jgi:hypothetical protein
VRQASTNDDILKGLVTEQRRPVRALIGTLAQRP